ncbi:MAG: hypothetical protein HEEMFOPI_02022 [Holosporales bacterium]
MKFKHINSVDVSVIFSAPAIALFRVEKSKGTENLSAT